MPSTDIEGNSQASEARPTITSLQDLTLIEAWDSKLRKPKYTTFYHVTPEEEVWFGQHYKNKREITMAEFNENIKRVKDEELYPKVPENVDLRIAREHLNDNNAFVKRPGLVCYEAMVGTEYTPTELLNETLAMEKVSRLDHPNIIGYLGCRTRRGVITSIFIEKLDMTLMQYASEPGYEQIDKKAFVEALQSAVDAIHALGLAHNDINPDNIMVRDDMPVLIDFGSCLPNGTRLQTGGTKGWVQEHTWFSDRKHDDFAMKKLPGWLEKPDVRQPLGEPAVSVNQV